MTDYRRFESGDLTSFWQFTYCSSCRFEIINYLAHGVILPAEINVCCSYSILHQGKVRTVAIGGWYDNVHLGSTRPKKQWKLLNDSRRKLLLDLYTNSLV